MNRISLLVLLPAVLAAQNSMPIMSGGLGLTSGVWVRYKTVVTWVGTRPASTRGSSTGISRSGDTVHRSVLDNGTGSWFGYDLEILPNKAADEYLATFGPATGSAPRGANLMPPPKFPAPQTVHDGDTIVLELMASPDGKQKITDYIEIFSHQPMPPAATTTAEPVDFSVDDGPLTFASMVMTVWKQGALVSRGTGFTGKPGATVSLAFPNQGRYILSLVAHDGFVKAGAIRDNVIAFEDAGVPYEIRFMEPIAGAGKAWNLYMMHDLNFQPPERQRNTVIVTTDRMENLLSKP